MELGEVVKVPAELRHLIVQIIQTGPAAKLFNVVDHGPRVFLPNPESRVFLGNCLATYLLNAVFDQLHALESGEDSMHEDHGLVGQYVEQAGQYPKEDLLHCPVLGLHQTTASFAIFQSYALFELG